MSDHDAALEFLTEVLGCESRTDVGLWPGAQMIEVMPAGSRVFLVLLPPTAGRDHDPEGDL